MIKRAEARRDPDFARALERFRRQTRDLLRIYDTSEALAKTLPEFLAEAGVATQDCENDLRFRIGAAVGDVVPPEDQEEAIAVAREILTKAYERAARAGIRHMPDDVMDGFLNGLRYRKNEPGDDGTRSVLVAAAANDPVPPPPPPMASLFQAYEDLADAPPPSWLVEGAIPDAGVTVIYGPPKSGKSLFATDLAASIVAGTGRWCGSAEIRCEPGPVLFFALEGRAVTVARVTQWREAHDGADLGRRLVFGDARALMAMPKPPDLARQVTEALGRPRLVIIDTWAHLMAAWGLDENATRDQNLAAKWAEAFSEAIGAPVLVIAHSGKEDRGIRGSNALEAAAAAVLSAKAEGGRFTLEARLLRSAEPTFKMVAIGAPVLKAVSAPASAEEPDYVPVTREAIIGPDETRLEEAIVQASDTLARHGIGEERIASFVKTVAAMAGCGPKTEKETAARAERKLRAAGLVAGFLVTILPGEDMRHRLAKKGAFLE